MKFDSYKLWSDFVCYFKQNIRAYNDSSPTSLSNALLDRSYMTCFYKTKLFPKIAKDLGLEQSEKEYLRVDVMFHKKGTCGFEIPIIFIESENDGNDEKEGHIQVEVHKLCSLNSPLKILFTRNWYRDAFKDEDNWWEYVIKDFVVENKLIGYFGVIAAEWENENLIYHYIVYGEDGNPVGEAEQLILYSPV